jgi:hypothetical protein
LVSNVVFEFKFVLAFKTGNGKGMLKSSWVTGVAMMLVLGTGFWRESWVLPVIWWVWENPKMGNKKKTVSFK